MMTHMRHFTTTGFSLLAAALLLGGQSQASAAFSENFDGFAAGTTDTELIHNQDANWVPASGAAWHVRDSEGYGGSNYLRQEGGASTYLRDFEASEIVAGVTNDTFEAKMVFASTNEVRYSNSWLWVGKDDGAGNQIGVGLRFNNGSSAQTTPNAVVSGSSIAPMTGGTTWSDGGLGAAYRDGDENVIRWKRDIWYTIQYADLLSGSPTLTIFETDTPGNVLIDGVAIGSYGAGTLDELNVVGVRGSSGDQRGQKYDEMAFVPEPASLALLGIGSLLIGRRRR